MSGQQAAGSRQQKTKVGTALRSPILCCPLPAARCLLIPFFILHSSFCNLH